jgi:hypothetical protein
MQFTASKLCSQILTGSLLAVVLAFSSANVARADARTDTVNSLTDWVFYSVHPELNQRSILAHETAYIREWNSIQALLNQRVRPSTEVCFGDGTPGEWEFSPESGQSFSEAYDQIADTIFHSRYPQRNGARIDARDTAAVREWNAIRDNIFISTCGL